MPPNSARWSCVRDRLLARVGEERFAAWFAGLKCEGVRGESIYLSVPSRFIKCFIQEHFAETVRTCCKAEMPDVEYIGIGVRNGLHVAPPRPAQHPSVAAPTPPRLVDVPEPHPFDNVPRELAVAVADYLVRAEKAGAREAAVADLVELVRPRSGEIARIQAAVAKHYGISRRELISDRRYHALPRQIAMFLARALTAQSLSVIGRAFAGRDHTTVHYGIQKIERLRAVDEDLRASVDGLLEQLTARVVVCTLAGEAAEAMHG